MYFNLIQLNKTFILNNILYYIFNIKYKFTSIKIV